MQHEKNRTLTFLFSRNQYRKMLVFYSSFTLFVIGVVSLVLTTYFNNALSKEINISNKRFLTQVQIAADSKLANLQSFILERFVSINNENSINQFLAGSSGASLIVDSFGIVSDYTHTNNFIDSIYVYRKTDDTLISSREGVVFGLSDPGNYNRQYIMFEPITTAMASNDNMRWSNPDENKAKNGRNILSLAYTLPLYKPSSEKLGAVVINIDEQRFLEAINQYTGMDYTLGIVNSSGDVLAYHNAKTSGGAGRDLPYRVEMTKQKEGFTTVQWNGDIHGVSWISSAIQDWKFVSVMPIKSLNKQLSLAKQFAAATLAAVILFTLAGLRLITKSIHKPIRQLLRTAAGKFNLPYDNTNEITFFDKVITNLSSRMEEMESMISHNQPLIRHKRLFDLLTNESYAETEEEIREKLTVAGIAWKYDSFIVIAADIQPRELDKLPSKQREFVTYKLMEEIDGYFTDGSQSSSISVGHNRIVSIVNYDSRRQVLPEPHLLMELCAKFVGPSCNLAISEPVRQAVELGRLYEQTGDFLQYGFLYGYGQIFTPEQIEELVDVKKYMEPHMLDELVPLLKACKKSQLFQQLTQIFHFLKHERVSYMYTQNTLMHILTLISNAAKENRSDTAELDRNRMFARLRETESLDDCRVWIGSLIEQYAERMNERLNLIDEQFTARISRYIVENIDKDISLNSVADHFMMSSSHISKMFKESTGINFSVFVADQKLLKAKDLLLQDKKLKIADVANSLGYYNLPYFISIFKEKHGITPAKLRKEHVDLDARS